jgi:DNA-binding beta-propeller fold protein YncE
MNRQLQKGIRVSKHSSPRKPRLRRAGAAGLAHSDAVRGRGAPALRLLAPFALVVAVLAFAAGPAFAARGHEFKASFGEPCPELEVPCGPGKLKEPAGVAVNEASSDVYVVDKGNDRVQRFSSTGTFLGQFDASGSFEVEGNPETGEAAPTGQLLEPQTIAVDNNSSSPSHGDVYVADVGHSVIDKFSPTGAYLGQLTGTCENPNENPAEPGACPGSHAAAAIPFSGLLGLATDPSGVLWVYQSSAEIDSFSSAEANEFLSRRTNPESFAASNGLAVDSADNLYVKNAFGTVSKLNSSGEVLSANFYKQPAEPGLLAVESSSNDLYVAAADEEGSVARLTSAGSPVEKFGAGRLASGSGVAINSAGGEVFVADSAAGEVDLFTLEPASAPEIASESVSQVTATGASFETELNPHGLPTTYRFEYGLSSAYSSSAPVPPASAGSEFGVLSFSVLVQGLTPGTTYHYRLVAENPLAQGLTAVFGPDRQFTTQSGGASVLPDGRQWELVSPPDKNGAPLEGLTVEGSVIQAAADGSALTYIARDPVTSDPAGNRSFAEDQLFASRGADGGWITQDIATPHESPAGLVSGELSEYRLFSPDLSSGVVQPANFTPLAPTVTERTPYLREQNGEYLPLVTAANVPPGTKFGSVEENGQVLSASGVEFVAASPDLSHVVLRAPQSLSAGFDTGGQLALYEWSGGALAPASVLPGGISAGEEGGAFLGQHGALLRHAISADGSRVIFGTQREQHLYVRDMVTGNTSQLDVPEQGAEGGGGEALFQDANSDGTRIFFQDRARLTADSHADSNFGFTDLYMCELGSTLDEESCAAQGGLTDLTVTNGEPADVQGTSIGLSEDGSTIYFVANGILTNEGAPVSGAVQGDCANRGQFFIPAHLCNLYRWHDGTVSVVAVLSEADFPDWEADEVSHTNLARMTARVSPNGRFLAFMSERSLTGYDNRDAASGQLDEEAYLYDSTAGKLVCASCDPSGARPLGEFEPPREEKGSFPLSDGVGNWQERWVAGSIPGWTPVTGSTALYQSRYLSDQGRLFFNSPVGLAPKDSNGTQDVYEYEPTGIGSCTMATAGFTQGAGGCVELISGGTSARESVFLDASESGNDVFFLTTSKLALQDVDSALDAYDAHVCTTAIPCPPPASPPPPACEGDACQLPATPPNDATPGSLTFNGAGNVVECPKGKVKQKGKCVKKQQTKAKKKHHSNSNKKKGKKQSKNKRANSKHGGHK